MTRWLIDYAMGSESFLGERPSPKRLVLSPAMATPSLDIDLSVYQQYLYKSLHVFAMYTHTGYQWYSVKLVDSDEWVIGASFGTTSAYNEFVQTLVGPFGIINAPGYSFPLGSSSS